MKPKRRYVNPNEFVYDYRGWEIEPRGGCSMIRHFTASKGDKWMWAFRLRDAVQQIDTVERGGTVPEMHLRALYA
jgi:hypothetical protein